MSLFLLFLILEIHTDFTLDEINVIKDFSFIDQYESIEYHREEYDILSNYKNIQKIVSSI